MEAIYTKLIVIGIVLILLLCAIVFKKAKRINDFKDASFSKCTIKHMHGDMEYVKRECGLKWYIWGKISDEIDIYAITNRFGKYVHVNVGYDDCENNDFYKFLNENGIRFISYGHSGDDWNIGSVQYVAGYYSVEDANKALSYLQTYTSNRKSIPNYVESVDAMLQSKNLECRCNI